MKKHLIAILCILAYANVYTQDLIERTRNSIEPYSKVSKSGNKSTKSSSGYDLISPFTINNNKSSTKYQEVYLDLNYSDLTSLKRKSNKNLLIPVGNQKHISLLIEPVELIHSGSKVLDAEGVELNIKRGVFYRGHVSDDPTSTVSISLFHKQLRIVISDAYGNYNIGQTESSKSYVLYNDMNLGAQPFECKNDELKLEIPEKIKQSVNTQYLKNTNCIKVYVEADYTTYLNFNSNAQAVASFVEGAFNEVATIYENSGISIQLSDIKVWTTSDPYNANINVGAALSYANSNVSNFNGDLFHLISATGNCCGWSGVGYVGYNSTTGKFNGSTVCGANPYAVSQTSLYYESLPAYSWTVNVLAHEMGHNMGSPHTHQCLWGANYDTPIDGCITPDASCTNPGLPDVGSVMSYCHTRSNVGISLANGFHPEVGAHLLQQYNSRTCLSSCVPIIGCTEEEGHNYNPLATVSDDNCGGTCNDGILNGDEISIDCGGSKCGICEAECSESLYELEIIFDRYAEESSWDIKDINGDIVYAGSGYNSYGEGSTLTLSLCLPDGEFTFTMYDSYGDGMCCSFGNGSFSLSTDGIEILSGAEFTQSESTVFIVEGSDTCSDGILNGDETDIDCGGSSCPPCDMPTMCTEIVILEEDHFTGFEGSSDIWIQNEQDDIDFSIISGATPTANTGPDGASEGNNYYYIESSSPNFPAKVAEIKSKCIDLSDLIAPVFTFDYHMYGAGMGTFDVSIVNTETEAIQSLWSVEGQQGDHWNSASIDLSPYQSNIVQLILTATTGTNHTSDLAIDKLSIVQSLSDCGEESLTYSTSSDVNISGTEEMIVKTTIMVESKITVDEAATLVWQAGESIEINGEFEVMPGAEATLKTEDCNNQ